MYKIDTIADFFIRQADCEAGDVITHLKLQKLVYYAQGWYLAIHDQPLFESRIEAWAHGPASPELWARFKDKGWSAITNEDVVSDEALDPATSDFLKELWSIYGPFTAKRLEEMTHDETPWREARNGLPDYAKCDREISQFSMKNYFASQLSRG